MEFRFKEIREEKELKQQDIANKINISRGGYANIEAEIANIKLRDLLKYCNCFNLSIDYVCKLTNTNKTNFVVLPNIDKKIMSERLTKLEIEQGKKAKDIAHELGIQKNTYSYYKNINSNNVMQTLMLKHLCQKYGYSMDWIVGRSSQKYR